MSSNLQCSQVERTWKLLCIRFYVMQCKFFALHSSEAENSSQHHHHRSLHPYIQGSISAYESLCKPFVKPFPLSRCVLFICKMLKNHELFIWNVSRLFFRLSNILTEWKKIDSKDEIQRDPRSELENFMSHPIDAEMRKVTFEVSNITSTGKKAAHERGVHQWYFSTKMDRSEKITKLIFKFKNF